VGSGVIGVGTGVIGVGAGLPPIFMQNKGPKIAGANTMKNTGMT